MVMQIGIPLVGGKFWHGGVTYVEALVKSLRRLPGDQQPRVYLIVDRANAANLQAHLHFAAMIDGVIAIGDVPAISDDSCVPTTRVARRRELVDHVDFIFPVNTNVMPGFCHASWIPDFQHRHFRQLFSAEDFDRRESAIRDVLELAQLIVVSSDAAKKDLMNLYDDSGERVRVLPFHVGIDQAWLEADPAAKLSAYGVSDDFVICCNQFWQHKNHEVLFRALARTRNRINLVCTGAAEDYRNRDWFARLTALIEELGIQSRVFLSGFIPRFDQIQLMRCAIAVVQPSLHEGWSSVLEDARALGKPVLASNLAVHEEQAVPGARYFSPNDADELFMLLDEAYLCHVPGPDRSAEQIAQREVAIKQELAGRKIMMIAEEAVSGFNATSLGNCSKPAAVERILTERKHSLIDQVTEKEEVIQGLQAELEAVTAEAERRREALEAVTADRDAWEARYQQFTAEAERRREALEAVTAKLDAATQKSSSAIPEELATSDGYVAESRLARNPTASRSHTTVNPVGPLVSIITPSYNQGRFIEETILSVLTQDYPNIEYIVIDGGSTDNTLDILKKYEGQLAWISEPDRGQSQAINKGFRMAKGEILAWLNSDDTYLPGAIGKVVQHFQANPAVMMVYGEGYLIDEHSRVKQRFPYTEAFDLWKLVYLWDNILQQTAFFRGQVFDHIDLLDENLHYGMDWDLWIRIGKKFRVDYIPEYLGNLREYSEAKTFSGGTTRFNELVSLMRRHGTMRFPPAYFTYGFGTYNRTMFGRLAHQHPRLNQLFFSTLRQIGQRVSGLITRYLVTHSQGYYSDGWASPKAHFLLVNPGQASYLRLEGELINLRRGFYTVIRARVNGRPLGDPITVFPGHFKLEWVIPQEMRSSDLFEVTLLSTRWHRPSLVGANTDRRRLSYRITRISAE